jgi:hypothetical protein
MGGVPVIAANLNQMPIGRIFLKFALDSRRIWTKTAATDQPALQALLLGSSQRGKK